MAKLKAPLLSLGASGAIGKSLVYFGWKGLDVVREYVIPANPKSALQLAQRARLRAAVLAIHDCQALAVTPLDAEDQVAYALWGSIFATPRTWFNTICKNIIDLIIAGKNYVIFTDGASSAVAGTTATLTIHVKINPGNAHKFYYGTLKTNMVLSSATVYVTDSDIYTVGLTSLTPKTKYYWQCRPIAGEASEGARSGIYHFTTTA